MDALQALFSRATGNPHGGLINKRNGGQTASSCRGLRLEAATDYTIRTGKKTMSQHRMTSVRVRNLFVAALMLACTFGTPLTQWRRRSARRLLQHALRPRGEAPHTYSATELEHKVISVYRRATVLLPLPGMLTMPAPKPPSR